MIHSTKLVMMETRLIQIFVQMHVRISDVAILLDSQGKPAMMETKYRKMSVQTLVKTQYVEMGTYSQVTTKNVMKD